VKRLPQNVKRLLLKRHGEQGQHLRIFGRFVRAVTLHNLYIALLARLPFTKLGVAWEPTDAERAYNEGRSTQVPVNPVVRVKGRFSRRLSDGKRELVLER